MYKRVLYGRVS